MSQHDAISETIEGHKYEMFMLPPLESHDLFMDVVKMIGPSLGPVVDALFVGKKNVDLDSLMEKEIGADFFAKAVSEFFEALDKSVVRHAIDALTKATLVDGKPLDKLFDTHFKGELGAMYKWLGWGMKVQWGKSLSALVSGIQNQGARALAQRTESQSQSTLSAAG